MTSKGVGLGQSGIGGAIEDALGVTLKRNCNLYLYFLCLGLLKTHAKGLIALVIPYEWVSRPSASPVRDYIRANRWGVTVYRFRERIFKGVLTTASVTIIDKSLKDGKWSFFDLDRSFKLVPRRGPAESKEGVIGYEKRGRAWALRGLSPGTQKVFTLTEGERNHCLDYRSALLHPSGCRFTRVYSRGCQSPAESGESELGRKHGESGSVLQSQRVRDGARGHVR